VTATPLRVDIVSIFPEYLAPLGLSLVGRASATGLLEIAVHDLRHWTHDVHRTVDDTPYGGGPGMVMRPEPWGAAIDALAPAPVAAPVPAGVVGTGAAGGGAAGGAEPAGAFARPFTDSRPSVIWSSPAAGTRGSTSGCSTTRPSGCR
jgi:tRNA (guanine37-N1)-methyltransferase